jgi:hypothetical protein
MTALNVNKSKLCNKCLTSFLEQDFHKDKTKSDGLHSICKYCQKKNKDARKEEAKLVKQNYEKENKNKIKDYWKEYNSNTNLKEKLKEKHLKKTYNLTLNELELLKEKQNYCCAICETHENDCSRKTLFVDHNHNTGEIRGLLCSQCNSALGLMYDDVSLLKNAINYLGKHDGS